MVLTKIQCIFSWTGIRLGGTTTHAETVLPVSIKQIVRSRTLVEDYIVIAVLIIVESAARTIDFQHFRTAVTSMSKPKMNGYYEC